MRHNTLDTRTALRTIVIGLALSVLSACTPGVPGSAVLHTLPDDTRVAIVAMNTGAPFRDREGRKASVVAIAVTDSLRWSKTREAFSRDDVLAGGTSRALRDGHGGSQPMCLVGRFADRAAATALLRHRSAIVEQYRGADVWKETTTEQSSELWPLHFADLGDQLFVASPEIANVRAMIDRHLGSRNVPQALRYGLMFVPENARLFAVASPFDGESGVGSQLFTPGRPPKRLVISSTLTAAFKHDVFWQGGEMQPKAVESIVEARQQVDAWSHARLTDQTAALGQKPGLWYCLGTLQLYPELLAGENGPAPK